MVYRVFVEKKPGLDAEAARLLRDARELLGVSGLERVRVLNRYDAEGLSSELFGTACRSVFSEPQVDDVCAEPELSGAAAVFAVEYLPGQFDQRADSAAQCIQLISCGERPAVRSARVYALYGALTDDEIDKIRKYVINPVDSREVAMETPETLALDYDRPASVETLAGFRELDRAALERFAAERGLAMDCDDLAFCQTYFRGERRDPTITEVRVIDTYWSDHCRHTTFNTVLDSVRFADPLLQRAWQHYLDTRAALGRTKPICLMDLGTIAAKALKAAGRLDKLDESEEINACTVKLDVTVNGKAEPWLLLFKNETHNHPTEIEPFGGAATCIGGAIRDPLSGRGYVYGAMRLTGAADPLQRVDETLPGKLPQRKICTGAAEGYSSYGNQIGLATGLVDEVYHPGYAAKRMEIGAVVAAAPAANVRRERPAPGDVVILLGGSTGRDGIGGATGSSRAHDSRSVERCGAEVQKGNAPEERKLQRLFRNPAASRLIKRCNDFGAGGVSVAIGELADGLDIDLNAVPKKYEGLDGTELAISESQERMAVVVAPEDAAQMLALAAEENLQAVPVARVTAEPRLRMHWNGSTIVDISREFLDTNGAEKHADAAPAAPALKAQRFDGGFAENLRALAGSLQCCTRRGLSERFDSTIGAGTVLMPFGGARQRTPIQTMAQKISLERGETDDCTLMSWGFDPALSAESPYHGAYCAVVESVCRLVASGAAFEDVYLSFQEYFPRLGVSPERWGQPLAALLGAFEAQMALGVAAIGGKDSMSGSFESLDVPPTLVSFAVTPAKTGEVVSPEFKSAGHSAVLLTAETDADGLPTGESLTALFARVTALLRSGKAVACYAPGVGGLADAVLKMCLGNGLGFRFAEGLDMQTLFARRCGTFVLEVTERVPGALTLGEVTAEPVLALGGETVFLAELEALSEAKLEPVYPSCVPAQGGAAEDFSYTGPRQLPAVHIRTAKPRFLIPVFPGTNCEYDSARAVERAGGEAEVFIVRNLSAADVECSVERFAARVQDSQAIFIPGGFSGGDEPDGSGKFITAFFRSGAVREAVTALLDDRGGLMCGICNGFQALIKLGLVPYGRIMDTDENCPTLTHNLIGRHQSRIVRTRIASNKSPWLAETRVGEVYSVPISHGEGRFYADEALIRRLAENGQIATQYADAAGHASMDIRFNPNGSASAVEGITSPDGRVFGKMGHAERVGSGLYKNVPGDYDIKMFASAVRYFK